jgi:hypothetical protein
MTNPLIDKYFELYPEKKEKPKLPIIEDYKGEKSYAEELEELRDTSTIPVSKIKSYDINSVNVSFHQVVEQVKKGEAQVSSMSMERNAHLAFNKITFEVVVYEP